MSRPYHVAVIGLGAMGMGAAQSCLRAGLVTYGIDLCATAREQLQAAGAAAVMTDARPLAETLEAVLLLVVNAAQVRKILFGEHGLAAHLKPGTGIMISSTIPAEEAAALARELATLDLPMLDAPVSGGAIKAEAGEMTVMAAGSDAAFDKLALCSMRWPARSTGSAANRARVARSRSFTSCWPACTSPWPPKPWRWRAGPACP